MLILKYFDAVMIALYKVKIYSGYYMMKRVLLVDDDDSVRGFLAMALRRAGYEVIAVDTAEMALNFFEQEHVGGVDLLLTDIVLPGMDGLALAKRANDHQPDIHVLFITGFSGIAMKYQKSQQSISLSGNLLGNTPVRSAAILSKPFHLKDLVTEVDSILKKAA